MILCFIIECSWLCFHFCSGIGDLTKINIPAGDSGGELDPHGADGNGEYTSSRTLFTKAHMRSWERQPDRGTCVLERVRWRNATDA